MRFCFLFVCWFEVLLWFLNIVFLPPPLLFPTSCLACAAVHAVANVPTGWQPVGDAHGNVKFHLALRHANPTAIEEKLHAVSDPASSDYGNHWTREELKAHAQPVDGSVERVTTWLNAAGITGWRISWNTWFACLPLPQAGSVRVCVCVCSLPPFFALPPYLFAHTCGCY